MTRTDAPQGIAAPHLTPTSRHMILTGARIAQEVQAGRIHIAPFDPKQLNPNSYNVRLGHELVVYDDAVLDARVAPSARTLSIPDEGLVLEPGELYLGATVEVAGSTHHVPMLFGRSSIARLGLFVQITAPLGDLGYVGRWTLQLNAIRPLRIYAGTPLAQLMFLEAAGERALYEGKYQGADTARPSELWRAFEADDDASDEGAR